MADQWDRIPADAFMEILRRLPASPRRRLRLVCRHWRNVIDDRTPATQARAKVLVFVGGPRAYALDDLTESGTNGRELELPHGRFNQGPSMVGTCNGLLCLRRWRDDLVVVNPVTGEKLAVPPPPNGPRAYGLAAAFSFAYHPATGLYKIVHVPSLSGAVKVFTLGDRSWREVSVPYGMNCLNEFGLVSVNGATYWVATDGHSVMSLDLKEERVVFVATLPVRVGRGLDLPWHLSVLRGRLVLAVCFYEMKLSRRLKGVQTTKMWMLKDGAGRSKKQPAWVLWYKVVEPGQEQPQGVAWPHAIHGQHLLTTRASEGNRVSLHASHLSKVRKKHGGLVRTEGSLSIGLYNDYRSLRTFTYVKTTEPLSFYGWSDYDISDSEDWDWRFDDREQRWKLMPYH